MCHSKEKYYKLDRFETICGWGMVEDVIISDEYEGITIGMNIKQAERLIEGLQRALAHAKEMQERLEEYMLKERELGKE